MYVVLWQPCKYEIFLLVRMIKPLFLGDRDWFIRQSYKFLRFWQGLCRTVPQKDWSFRISAFSSRATWGTSRGFSIEISCWKVFNRFQLHPRVMGQKRRLQGWRSVSKVVSIQNRERKNSNSLINTISSSSRSSQWYHGQIWCCPKL